MIKEGVKISSKNSIFFLIFFLILVFFILYFTQTYPSNPQLGISYSGKYAKELGLNEKEVYLSILDDFDISEIKLSTYFNEIQPQRDVYDFSSLDWYVQEAKKRRVNLILAIGLRTPRWPECHPPEWWNQLNTEEKEKALLHYVQTVVNRYKDAENVIAWQVENEPLLGTFGSCPPFPIDLYEREVALVRSISSKPIIGTVSGELENWRKLEPYVDIIGSSMYRYVWSPVGYINFDFFFPPAFYEGKRRFLSKPVYITEFQAEPWATEAITQITSEEEAITMSHEHFKYLFTFLRKHQFDKFFLWGAEWWYYKKVQQNDNFYWEYAKEQINAL